MEQNANKNKIYVVGHKNPDTDSISAALSYADLKNKLGEEATACRLGPLSEDEGVQVDGRYDESVDHVGCCHYGCRRIGWYLLRCRTGEIGFAGVVETMHDCG